MASLIIITEAPMRYPGGVRGRSRPPRSPGRPISDLGRRGLQPTRDRTRSARSGSVVPARPTTSSESGDGRSWGCSACQHALRDPDRAGPHRGSRSCGGISAISGRRSGPTRPRGLLPRGALRPLASTGCASWPPAHRHGPRSCRETTSARAGWSEAGRARAGNRPASGSPQSFTGVRGPLRCPLRSR